METIRHIESINSNSKCISVHPALCGELEHVRTKQFYYDFHDSPLFSWCKTCVSLLPDLDYVNLTPL